jgi:lysophospholipase L1-like esterase
MLGARRYAAALLGAAALVLGAATTPVASGAPARAASHHLLVDGDSLAVGTEPYLPRDLPGWRVRQSASVSRHAPDGVELLRSYGSRLPRVVFISLGTNDDPRFVSTFRTAIRRALRIVGPHRCIVWATVHRPPVAGTSYAGYNRVLRDMGRREPRLRAFDWERMAHRHPSWFGSDGVHPGPTGYRARARAIARNVERCTGS